MLWHRFKVNSCVHHFIVSFITNSAMLVTSYGIKSIGLEKHFSFEQVHYALSQVSLI